MASTYAKNKTFGNSSRLTRLLGSETKAAPVADIKPKLTVGLNSTHGLNKNYSGPNVSRLLEQVASYKFKDYFLDFDRLRKGKVSEARFISAFGNTKVEFTDDEMQELISKYGSGDGQVDYRSFVDDLDKYFRKEVDSSASAASKFSKQEIKLLTDTIKVLINTIKANRILLKPSFADFDITKKQRVTVHQFSRVLKQLQIMPSDEAFEVICKKYFDKSNTREIDYVSFCHDVDKPQDMFAELGITMDTFKPSTSDKISGSVIGKAMKSNFFESTTKGINVLENRFSKPTINLANDPRDVEERIQAQVITKRTRIGEFFRDYDKLRKGKVTGNQFTTVLSMLDFKLSDEEYDFLTEKYKTDDGMVRYVEFVENIDSAFTIKGLDKNPTIKVAPVAKPALLKKKLEYDDEEEKEMINLMEEYRKVVITRMLNLKPMFQDFDKTKSGYVTKTQFVRVLNQLGIDLPHDVLSLLLKKYMDKGNAHEVNYFEFINDVDKPEDMFGAGRDFNHSYNYFSVTDPRKVENQIVKLDPEDIDDLLARVRKECSEKRIRLQEFFRDFDRLRSGNITAAQLRIGMNMAKIDLSQAEFDYFCDHYKSDKVGKVKWKDLCDDVDQVFVAKGLEKDATLEFTAPTVDTRYGKTAPVKADKNLAHKVVQKFKLKLQRERLDAKSFFQSWDKHNRFKVSPKQFRQVLATFGFEMTDSEAEALCKLYANKDGEIDYLRFLKDSNPDNQIELEQTKSKYVSKGFKFDGVTDFDSLILKIKGIVKKGRIRLLEYFQDHDMLRKGHVTIVKFKGVIRSQKIELTDKEYETLIEKFKLESDSNLVDYVSFNEEIEGIFTKKGLEKAPTVKPEEFKVPTIIDPDDVLNDAEEKSLEDCLQRIGVEVKNRRLLLKPFFQDKDKINCGFVANSRFRSIFDFQKLYISDDEYKIINKRFAAKAPNEINYKDFDTVLKRYSGDIEPF